MTLFGKILLFFNLLAGGAFAYFAMQDFFGEKGKGNGRQAITAAGVRHLLLINGLPVGGEKGSKPGGDGKAAPSPELDDPESLPSDPEAEIPFKIVMAGGFRTETISKKLLETYFQAAGDGGSLGGGPVPNQLAEVKRVRAKIVDLLGKAEGPAKSTLLAGWLLLQAETFEERVAIQELMAAGTPEAAEAMEKRLLAKFDAVLAAPKPADAEATSKLADADAEDAAKQKEKIEKVEASRLLPQEESERRARLAHLLVHLDQSAAWQKRVMVVVGLRRFASAIAAQVERFRDMSARVEMLIATDQTSYLAEERSFLRLAIDRTEMSGRQAALKLKWSEQKLKEDNFVAERTTQLNAIKAQLKKMKAEVDELLAKQTTVEAGLFEVQREVAITLDEVYQLELKLEARERDLLRLPPRPVGKE